MRLPWNRKYMEIGFHVILTVLLLVGMIALLLRLSVAKNVILQTAGTFLAVFAPVFWAFFFTLLLEPEEMHGDPNIFSEAYVAATLREAKRDRAFYRAYFEKFGTAEVEKGYQTLFENVFKPFFRRLGIESEHCMEYHFEFVKAGYFAVTRKWLLYGCPETPEEMAKIIKRSMAAIPDDLPPVPDELFI